MRNTRFIDLTGLKFNHLTVIKRHPKPHPTTWICKCDCGKITRKDSQNLKRGITKSCGCIKPIDDKVVGTTINSWYIAEKMPERYKDNGIMYRCIRKECGCEKRVSLRFIKRLKHNWTCPKISKGTGQLSYKSFSRKRVSAKTKGKEFILTQKFLADLYEQQERKCAITGISITLFPEKERVYEETASLDRIDSDKGYVEGNVQWVHKDVNTMKWDFELDKLLLFAKLIVDKNEAKIKEILSRKDNSKLLNPASTIRKQKCQHIKRKSSNS